MTAAHLPGAILTPRYRGARAVANFNAADARSRATHLRAGWLPSVGVGHCNSQTGRHGPEMPARRSSARPAALFNAVSNERSPEPRPYAHMQADELADEITVARECIQTTRDLRLRKQMQAKLAELIAEENRRFTEGLPF